MIKDEAKAKEQAIQRRISKRLRYFRVLRGVSQQRLGRRLGCSFQQIQKYERGVNRISAAKLLIIAEILDLEVKDLYGSSIDDVAATAAVDTGKEVAGEDFSFFALRIIGQMEQVDRQERKAVQDLLAAMVKRARRSA